MKLLRFAELAFLCLGAAASTLAQTTPDETNTIGVFKAASASVVHVKATRSVPGPDGETRTGEGSGSGFFIDDAGHILTNYHVIENSSEVMLLLGEDRTLPATLVGTAPAIDIALLQAQMPPKTGKPVHLVLGDSDAVEVGQKVLAIGNPLGLHNTLTVGVVSGRARSIPGAPEGLGHAFLQTDAAINPGNSGGPLVDSAGRVIGINAVVAREGQNISFAIPANLVKKILPDLIEMGHVYRPALGFSAVPITAGMATLFGLPARSGLLVQEVAEGSPAAQAGLRAGTRMVPMNETVYVLGGDVVVEVNGKKLLSPHDLTTALLGSRPGEQIRLTVLRGEERQEKLITLPPMHY